MFAQPAPEVVARAQRLDEVQARIEEVCGVINAAMAELSAVTAQALEEDLWSGWKLHTPAKWLAWRTGLSPTQAANLVLVAERRAELPHLAEAFDAGHLSADQATEVARHVPTGFDRSAVEFARAATVQQLRYALPRHTYLDVEDRLALVRSRDQAPPGAGDPVPAGSEQGSATEAGPAGTERADPGPVGPAGAPGPPEADAAAGPVAAGGPSPEPDAPPVLAWPVGEESRASFGFDERGFYLSVRLPQDLGAVVGQALEAARESLYRQAVADLSDDAPRPRITNADAVVALAEAALTAGEARWPGSDRFVVHAHLEADPVGTNQATVHLGPVLPDHLRRLRTCDTRIQPVHRKGGTPVNLGRTTHTVPRRLRRLVQHRDGGCRVPGCARTWGTEIHHIVHWEDGGPTDTANLVCLCATHHRDHHRGLLGIVGDADHPDRHPEGLRYTDQWGRPLPGSAEPVPPDRTGGLRAAARTAAVRPGHYRHPDGGPFDPLQLAISPNDAGSPEALAHAREAHRRHVATCPHLWADAGIARPSSG